MHYGHLLLKGIQGGYFYITHFYKAKLISLILVLKTVYI